MLKIRLRFKTRNPVPLRGKLIALLLATLLITLPLHVSASQFLFDMDAITDLGSLAVKLQDTRAMVSKSIAEQLSNDTQWLLVGYDGISKPSPDLQKALISDLNQLIQTSSLYDAHLFAGIQLSKQTQALIAQNPKDGDALVRLNRSILADAYPYELASLSAQQHSQHSKGIEACRENLRQIKLAWENYRISNANSEPQWLSELSPQYLKKDVLLCPADPTAGKPGVLTQGAADPRLPCSYLYEFRAPERMTQKILQAQEGDMIPIVRCEHHLLNLSVSGKIYRNGPQRTIYTSNKTELSALSDFVRALRSQSGDDFLITQKGREKLKQTTEKLIIKQLVPKMLSSFEKEIYSQLEAQLGKKLLKTPMGMDILKQASAQINAAIEEKLLLQLQTQLGAEFFQTQEGEDIRQQLSALMSP